MGDLLNVIESAYDTEGDARRWMRRVIRAAQSHLDQGWGIFAALYDGSDDKRLRIEEIVGTGISIRGWAPLATWGASSLPPEAVRVAVRETSVSTASVIWPDWIESNFSMRRLAGFGVNDLLGINAGDPSGKGCAISVPLRARGPAPRETIVTWEKIAAHVAAGLRLRRAVQRIDGSTIDPLDDAEAVLDPDGKLRHAMGEAKTLESREVLRHAAVALDRARGRLRRRDPHEAIETWRALVDGRWTIFDHFDRDGRRFVIARRNDPEVREEDALTLRERQIVGYAAMGHANKLIAYELGLSPSTIGTHLSTAAQKLGVRTRVELIRRFTESLSAGSPETPSTPPPTGPTPRSSS